MALYDAGCLFKVLEDNAVEVYCGRCGESFGTMTTDTLATAIIYNVNRGGMLCPSCRSKICPKCFEDDVNPGHELCPWCELAREDLPGDWEDLMLV